jgi:hypothetical protein
MPREVLDLVLKRGDIITHSNVSWGCLETGVIELRSLKRYTGCDEIVKKLHTAIEGQPVPVVREGTTTSYYAYHPVTGKNLGHFFAQTAEDTEQFSAQFDISNELDDFIGSYLHSSV